MSRDIWSRRRMRHQPGIHQEPGFIDCTKKVDGKLGCKCSGFDEYALFEKARKEFFELMKKPVELQAHVMARLKGGDKDLVKYVSTGVDSSEAFDRKHKYQVTGFYYEYTIEQAIDSFNINKCNMSFSKKMKVFVDTKKIEEAKLIAMIPPVSPNEVSFITPILAEYVTKV